MPNHSVERETVAVTLPDAVQLVDDDEILAQIGFINQTARARQALIDLATEAQRIENQEHLHDEDENGRLMNALINYVHRHNNIYT